MEGNGAEDSPRPSAEFSEHLELFRSGYQTLTESVLDDLATGESAPESASEPASPAVSPNRLRRQSPKAAFHKSGVLTPSELEDSDWLTWKEHWLHWRKQQKARLGPTTANAPPTAH